MKEDSNSRRQRPIVCQVRSITWMPWNVWNGIRTRLLLITMAPFVKIDDPFFFKFFMKQYRKGEDPVQCTLHCPIIRGFLFCCFPHNLFYFYATYLSFLFSGIFFFHVLFLRCTCVFMIFAPFVTDFDVISFPIFLLFIFFM